MKGCCLTMRTIAAKLTEYPLEMEILNKLNNAGFEAFIIGGFVRDYLLEKSSNDIDIVTNAKPDDLKQLFKEKKLDMVGLNFGVVLIEGIEVATYRTDNYSSTTTKPTIRNVATLKEDTKRRDFTINALAINKEGELIDFTQGKIDLTNKTIRAIGDPLLRFNEDPSRILRAAYLSAKLGFIIEEQTLTAMKDSELLLSKVPNELKGKILTKVIKENVLAAYMHILVSLKLEDELTDSFIHLVNLVQNPKYHKLDAWQHTLETIKAYEKHHPVISESMALATLFHDIAKGKPTVRTVNALNLPSDIGHEEAGVSIARKILKKLAFSSKIIEDTLFLVKHHGLLRLNLQNTTTSHHKSIDKMLRVIANEKNVSNQSDLNKKMQELLLFSTYDAASFSDELQVIIKETNQIIMNHFPNLLSKNIYFRKDLLVKGQDILALGYQPQEIGVILTKLVKHTNKEITKEEQIKKIKEVYSH